MGMVIEGNWVDDDVQYRTASNGAFLRPQSVFTHWVTADGSSGFKVEPDRYHLFLAPNCPWAHRTQIFRRLKRLENVISVSLADLPRKRSWAYSKGIGRDLDPVDWVFELHQAYISTVPNYTGRVTVPTLWDKRSGRSSTTNRPRSSACSIRNSMSGAMLPSISTRLHCGPRSIRSTIASIRQSIMAFSAAASRSRSRLTKRRSGSSSTRWTIWRSYSDGSAICAANASRKPIGAST